MRNRETVLILGAGASETFGLPLGSGLRDRIASDLNIKFENGISLRSGSHEIVEALNRLVRSPDSPSSDINAFRQHSVKIAESMKISGSIDEYVERHGENEFIKICSKLAISKIILESEKKSKIYSDKFGGSGINIERSNESWLALFLIDLTRRHSRENISSAFSRLTIINFNYDRCFEHFCYNWLRLMYDISESEAAEIFSKIRIYHPYGKLGSLPFQQHADAVPFGAQGDPDRLIAISKRIRTYSESVNLGDEHQSMLENLHAAKAAVFMGFGFHQQNLDLLQLRSADGRDALTTYSTTLGISAPNWGVYQNRIRQSFQIPPDQYLHTHIYEGNCEEFWREFSDAILV